MPHFTFNSVVGKVPVNSYLANQLITSACFYCQSEEVELVKDTFPCYTHLYDTNFSVYSYDGEYLHFPTGMLRFLLSAFTKDKNTFEYTGLRAQLKKEISLESCLRPHQLEYIESITQNKRGFIQAYTSFGKSKSFINFLSQFVEGTPILIIVPTTTLLSQMSRDIVETLGIEVGQIGAGHYDIKDVTVCIPDTVYSRLKRNDESTLEYLHSIQVLIADEMHFYCNPTGAAVLNNCINAEYRLGTSATPNVKFNWFNESVYGHCLRIFKQEEGIELNYIENPLIYFIQAPSSYVSPQLLGAIKKRFSHVVYNKIYKSAIVRNKQRNQLIADVADHLIQLKEGPIVILFKQLEHASLLQEELKEIGYSDVPIIQGSTANKKREAIIQQMKEETVEVVLASESILGTGSSITTLAGAINAAAGRSENLLIQKLGRIVRNRNTNLRPYFIDFDDKGYFAKQSALRMANCLDNYEDVQKVTKGEFYDCISS